MLKTSDLPAHLQKQMGLKKVQKPHKYHVAAKADRTCGGITFDSKAEMTRYQALQLMVKAGAIYQLQRQVQFDLIAEGQFVCSYRADFVYVDMATGLKVVEDVKGVRTAEYKIKKKLMKALLGIEIREV